MNICHTIIISLSLLLVIEVIMFEKRIKKTQKR